MKILFLTNLLPYPANTGGKINTYTKLKMLKQYGHEVDLLSFYESSDRDMRAEAHLRQYCRDVFQIYNKLTTADHMAYMMKLAAKSLLSRYSLGVYKFYTKEMKDLLISLSNERSYDCIYYGHLQLFVYQTLIKDLWPKAKTVLDQHNCETVLMRRMAHNQSNMLKKSFLLMETEKLKSFENFALRTADITMVLSEEDKQAMERQLGSSFPSVIIPNRVDEVSKTKSSNEQNGKRIRILFVGTMTWMPNNEGIIWFLENVYNRLEKETDDFELTIVGKNPSAKVIELSKKLRNVTITGYVDSVDPYYEGCDMLVVPLFIGGGQRVKIIEAFSRKMPVISTTIGAEGLVYSQDKSIIIADDPESFCRGIYKMRDFEFRVSIAESARLIYEQNYSNEIIGKRLNQTLISLQESKFI